jgi:RNA polymerase sigma factor (sigma-70 family)
MGLPASSGRRKVAVIVAWAAIAGGVLAAALGVSALVETIRAPNGVEVGICVPLGGLVAIALCTLGPVSWAKLMALWRRSARVFGRIQPCVTYRPEHPIAAQESWLERLMQDTRSILHDMNHLAAAAEWWPSDGEPDGWLARLWSRVTGSLGHSLADFAEVNRITRDVWDWVRTVEALSPQARAHLEERGVHVEQLRATLLADDDFHGRFQAMVHLLRRYEDALFALPIDPFRGVGASQQGSSPSGTRRAQQPGSQLGGAERDRTDTSRRAQFEALVRRRESALRALAAKFARAPEDREDLVQDMLLAIWKALPQFRGESSLATYAQRIAYSTAVDYARRHRILLPEVDAEDRNASPEERIGRVMVGARLRNAIDALPRKLRQVLDLHLDGHDYREIAQRTGIGPSNVGARLTRARDRLRRRLGRLAQA